MACCQTQETDQHCRQEQHSSSTAIHVSITSLCTRAPEMQRKEQILLQFRCAGVHQALKQRLAYVRSHETKALSAQKQSYVQHETPLYCCTRACSASWTRQSTRSLMTEKPLCKMLWHRLPCRRSLCHVQANMFATVVRVPTYLMPMPLNHLALLRWDTTQAHTADCRTL